MRLGALLSVLLACVLATWLPGCASGTAQKAIDDSLNNRGGSAETDQVNVKPLVANTTAGDATVEGDIGWTRENLATGAGWVMALNLAGETSSTPDSVERALQAMAESARAVWAKSPTDENLAVARTALQELRDYRLARREASSTAQPAYPNLHSIVNVMVANSGVGTQDDPVSPEALRQAVGIAKEVREMRGGAADDDGAKAEEPADDPAPAGGTTGGGG